MVQEEGVLILSRFREVLGCTHRDTGALNRRNTVYRYLYIMCVIYHVLNH